MLEQSSRTATVEFVENVIPESTFGLKQRGVTVLNGWSEIEWGNKLYLTYLFHTYLLRLPVCEESCKSELSQQTEIFCLSLSIFSMFSFYSTLITSLQGLEVARTARMFYKNQSSSITLPTSQIIWSQWYLEYCFYLMGPFSLHFGELVRSFYWVTQSWFFNSNEVATINSQLNVKS